MPITYGFSNIRISICYWQALKSPYDPTGQTKAYFLPLYEEMRKANGKWPYAIVATSDDIVVYVSYPASDGISLDYEQFAAP